MNFQITIPPDEVSSPQVSRHESTSTDASGIEDLVEDVLNSIEEHEEKHQQKLFNSRVYSKHGWSTSHSHSPSASSSRSTPKSLPLSTTEPTVETQIAFITHHKHQSPHVSLTQNPSQHMLPSQLHTQPPPTYNIFSPNPFYPGQSLPILVQVHPQSPLNMQSPVTPVHSSSVSASPPYSNSYGSPQQRLPLLPHGSHPSLHSHHSAHTPLEPIMEDPLSKLEKALRDKDDTKDGHLDMEEFEEAIHEIDNAIHMNDLAQIFAQIAGKDHEISIAQILFHIKNAQKTTTHMTTPRTVFRGAFPGVFGDINDVENREIWGNAEMNDSIHQLEKALQEEAENEGVIDFPEFEAAISNMGIQLNKAHAEKLFAHFLGEQDVYDTKMGIKLRRYNTEQLLGINKKYELKLGFLMHILKQNVENHEHLQPKQILKLAFMELLLNDSDLNRQSSFLLKDEEEAMDLKEEQEEEEDEEEDLEESDVSSFKENPDFDKEINYDLEASDAEERDELRLGLGLRVPSLGKGDRSLMRMGSAQHWTDDDVIQQQHEMEQHYKMMMEQNQNGYYL